MSAARPQAHPSFGGGLSGRLQPGVALASLILMTACANAQTGLTQQEYDELIAWLDCEECVDGDCAPVTSAHAELKRALVSGGATTKSAAALAQALRENEAALRAFAGP